MYVSYSFRFPCIRQLFPCDMTTCKISMVKVLKHMDKAELVLLDAACL